MRRPHAEPPLATRIALPECEVVVQDLLGEGSHGRVHAGWLRGPGPLLRRVALKIPTEVATRDPDLLVRLRDEVRLGALVDHPGVVRYRGIATFEDNLPVVILALVDGEDLGPLLTRVGALAPSLVGQVGSQVADALHHLHHATGPDGRSLELVHRDLKPANLRLTPGGRCVLLDLGIARARTDCRAAATQHGCFGSAGYMAPERAAGVASAAVDIFSLGVVLWEMAAGRPLGMHAQLEADDHRAWVDLRMGQLPDAAQALVAPIRACLAHAPEARPTASELCTWLEGLRLDGPTLRTWARAHVQTPALSSPPSEWSRTWSTDREPETEPQVAIPQEAVPGRRRTPSLVVAAAALLVPLTATGAWWLVAPPTPQAVPVQPSVSPTARPTPPPPKTAPPSEPDPPHVPAKATGRTPARRPARRPPAPAPPEPAAPEPAAPEPAAPQPTGTLVVHGDAKAVRVVDHTGAAAAPGTVVVGTYSVERVTFDDRVVEGIDAWTVRVTLGGTAVISCQSAFSSCTTRESP